MGSSISNVKAAIPQNPSAVEKVSEEKKVRNFEKEIDVDVIEIANIALAIKHKQHISNLQLTLSLSALPNAKAFQELNTMIVVFKYIQGQAVELGRTQIISNEYNPKFLTSFVLVSSSQKQDQIQFRVYNCKQLSSNDLNEQTLVGTATHKLQILNDNETSELSLALVEQTSKEKTTLKITCCQYDGGSFKYFINLYVQEIIGGGKIQIYYIIEVLRDSQWIPVARSNHIEAKKKSQFDQVKVSANKFPSQDNTRIRIRFYDIDSHEEFGSTDQFILQTILQKKIGVQRIQKGGYVYGSVSRLDWKKKTTNSFLSFIVNGARLHLILGIDFTNSNFKGQNLHHQRDEFNMYIKAIREIVGMLQYFDYYNRIALYGFGAKLPPYYRTVGQCFALNGDYYHPLITGGVQQIIKYYRQTLKKIQPHGPTIISELIDMAIQFAQVEHQSSNYYVLIILTDGNIDDYSLAVQKIKQATSHPLSIVFVGLGDGDFSQLIKLQQQSQNLKLQNPDKLSDRKLVDIINFNDYLNQEKNAMAQTRLARKTFQKIPSQFVEYMRIKQSKPNKEKKSLKAAKSQFITQKIKESKSLPIFIPDIDFLKDQKKKMLKEVISLGFLPGQTLDKMPLNDLNYFIELESSTRPPRPIIPQPQYQVIASKQQKRFQQHLQRNQQFLSRRIQNELLKRQVNQAGRRRKIAQKAVQVVKKQKPKLIHPCLKCGENQICMLFMECGHLALCEGCCENICFICKQFNEAYININDYDRQI